MKRFPTLILALSVLLITQGCAMLPSDVAATGKEGLQKLFDEQFKQYGLRVTDVQNVSGTGDQLAATATVVCDGRARTLPISITLSDHQRNAEVSFSYKDEYWVQDALVGEWTDDMNSPLTTKRTILTFTQAGTVNYKIESTEGTGSELNDSNATFAFKFNIDGTYSVIGNESSVLVPIENTVGTKLAITYSQVNVDVPGNPEQASKAKEDLEGSAHLGVAQQFIVEWKSRDEFVFKDTHFFRKK